MFEVFLLVSFESFPFLFTPARIGSGQKGETFKTDKNWEWTEKGNFQN
jgi:hypothetical protein